MASAGALFHFMNMSPREERITQRFAIAGQAAELATMFVLEAHASKIERVGKPLKQGFSGFLWKTARVLGAASLVCGLWSRKSQRMKTAAGVCGTASALALRFSLLQAGRNSARDPLATFEQQHSQPAAAIEQHEAEVAA
jgi:hypothetical protein